VGHEIKLGYFSLQELKEAKGPMKLPIERDLYFDEQPLSQAAIYLPAPRATKKTIAMNIVLGRNNARGLINILTEIRKAGTNKDALKNSTRFINCPLV
jgi:hypothetical protein